MMGSDSTARRRFAPDCRIPPNAIHAPADHSKLARVFIPKTFERTRHATDMNPGSLENNQHFTLFTAFGKPEFTFAGSLRVGCGLKITFIIKRITVTRKWSRKRKGIPGLWRFYPQTLRVVCGFLGLPTHAHASLLAPPVLAPPVLAPSCRAPSCARALLRCASWPARWAPSWCLPLAPSCVAPLGLRHVPHIWCLPLSLRARSSLAPRSFLVPRSPLAPYPCLAWIRSERRARNRRGAGGDDMEVGDASKQHLKFQSKQLARYHAPVAMASSGDATYLRRAVGTLHPRS
jgi:hypothetical protein